MNPIPLPEDVNLLFALAEQITNVLAEKRASPGIAPDSEARLRASIAAAAFARSAYRAMLAGTAESPVACRFLAPARIARDRTEQQLRRRVARVIAEIRMLRTNDVSCSRFYSHSAV